MVDYHDPRKVIYQLNLDQLCIQSAVSTSARRQAVRKEIKSATKVVLSREWRGGEILSAYLAFLLAI